MRLESRQPKNESEFYGLLRDLTEGSYFYERVEPKNESGFPDVYFVPRNGKDREGTMELKFFTSEQKVDLKSAKVRGNQKAALIDYQVNGGNRRFILAYHDGYVHLWDTFNAVKALMGQECVCHTYTLEGGESQFIHWLREKLK